MGRSSNPRFWLPRSAYVHVPFCRHRCGYCNFTLVAGRDDLIPAYLSGIDTELSRLGEPCPVDTLFFGGGTPTQLDPQSLARLIERCRHGFPLATGYEFSVECNPLDLLTEKLDVLVAGGVSRLSLGVQSWSDGALALLERDHRAEQVEVALNRARQVMPNVALDLIYGVPGQTVADWEHDLARTIAWRPQHVSVYGLTFDRGASFWGRRQRGELIPCAEELERTMYELAIAALIDAGYEHYEVSNFALPGFRCRHNETYWLGRTYHAVGPGAARHVAGRRELNHRSTTTYLRRLQLGQSPVEESEFLDDESSARERLVFGLRRLEGVEFAPFAAETGFAIDQLCGTEIDLFVSHGWLRRDHERLALTSEGLLISDSLWSRILTVA